MKAESKNQPQVLVCQHGARHRYAVPRLFEEMGMLAGLYTDSTSHSLAGRIAQSLQRIGFKPSRLSALSARVPVGVPKQKIYSSDRPLHASVLMGAVSPELDDLFIRQGLNGAKVVYSMCGEDFGFLRWAKEQGAKLVIDIFVHPATLRLVQEESQRYRGMPSSDSSWVVAVENHFRRSFELADVILCPSNWVAEGVREYSPDSAGKIRIVPYGSSLNIRPSINERPKVGTVLFAGRDPLRKGLHHLAEAAYLVRERGLEIDVRVAGISAEEIGWMEHKDQLNCLGTLPMNRMHHEFEGADMFALPSLSEGQAGVLLEAMACGCPAIATRESGMDFEPGCGLIVPSGNPEALADAIESVVKDREKRTQLARGALPQAADFSMDAWKSRLKKTVEELL